MRVRVEGQWFEWEDAKAEANREKHGIEFEVALTVFFDENAVIQPDTTQQNENRWQIIGQAAGAFIPLFVVYTERKHYGEEVLRLISARKATKRESRKYKASRPD